MTAPVTQWFKGDPPYIGVWEVVLLPGRATEFRYWNGCRWSVGATSPRYAYKWASIPAYPSGRCFCFRGLADNPNSTKATHE